MRHKISQRSLLQNDAEEIYNLIQKNRTHLSKWFPWVSKTTSVSDTLMFIQKTKALLRTKKGLYSAIICDEEICGIVGANKLSDKDGCFEINFWVSKEFCNQGIATYCTSQLISFLKNNFSAKEIYIRIDKKNIISIKIVKKLGAELSRTFSDNDVCFEEHVLR